MALTNFRKLNKKKGSVLIFTLIILAIMIALGSYFISSSLAGSKISNSQEASIKAYYLAEAGVAEAIYKLKNDPVWKSAFETYPSAGDATCSSWSIASYTRDPALFSNGKYTINVTNLGCARAEIESKAEIELSPGRVSRREVKVQVFKGIGNAVSDFAIFTGGASGNISISDVSPLNIHNGNLFSNNNIIINWASTVNVDKKALATNNINVFWSSSLNATSCAANICDSGCDSSSECPPDAILTPPIDFDSASADSYLSLAKNSDCSSIRTDGKTNCVFTPAEFEDLMWYNYPELSLPTNTVVYVTGDINIRAGQELTVNGVLVSDKDINMGKDFLWIRWPTIRSGSCTVTVYRPGVPDDNEPSGLLAKRKINTGLFLGGLDVNGLIYSGDQFSLNSIGGGVEVHGGIVARKFSLSSLWHGVDLYLDSDVIIDTFKNSSYSPVIKINHWEEEY